MGIADRKEREKLELRKHILDAAMELFVELGYDKTSIRNIAEKVEYSAGAIYLYFKDKDEIFYELHDRAFDLLYAELSLSAALPHPLERLRDMGRRYLRFAMENPEMYDLMFIMRAPMNTLACGDRPEQWEKGFRNFDLLFNNVSDCIDQHLIVGGDKHVVTISIWSFVHGLASLYIRQRFKMIPEEQLHPLIEASLEGMVNLVRMKNEE